MNISSDPDPDVNEYLDPDYVPDETPAPPQSSDPSSRRGVGFISPWPDDDPRAFKQAPENHPSRTRTTESDDPELLNPVPETSKPVYPENPRDLPVAPPIADAPHIEVGGKEIPVARMKNVVPEGTEGIYVVRDKASGLLIDMAIDPITGRRRQRRIPLAYDEKGRPIWGYDSAGIPVCGAKSKSEVGHVCMSRARKDNGRCEHHFGNQLKGPAHVLFKHGRYSSAIPLHLGEDLSEMLTDPEYLSLRSNIALQDVRIMEGMRELDKGADSKTWMKLQKEKDRTSHLLNVNYPDKDRLIDDLRTTLSKMGALIEKGSTTARAWDDVTNASAQRAKLVSIEQNRLQIERNTISADTAYAIFAAIMAAIKQNVKDPIALANIARTIDQMALDPTKRQVVGGELSTKSMGVTSRLGSEVGSREVIAETLEEDLEDDSAILGYVPAVENPSDPIDPRNFEWEEDED